MIFRLKRIFFGKNYTIGHLYNGDGKRLCDTLEPERKPSLTGSTRNSSNSTNLTNSKGCIPAGKYRVVVTYSPKFRRRLPLLERVPGFTGIRIHAGNTRRNTRGCILPGENREVGKVLNSRHWEEEIIRLIDNSHSPVWLEISDS